MHRCAIVLTVAASVLVSVSELDARGRGGFGGGGFRGGGGGISRPSGGMSRPGGGISRPSGGISRPSGGRPSSPSISRPSPSRPSSPSFNRPSASRPSTPRPGTRPSTPSGSRPGIGSGTRPSITPGKRPGITPGQRPSITPGQRPNLTPGAGQRPSLTPGTGQRPGAGTGIADRPGIGTGQRPSQLPSRPSTRPGAGNRPGLATGAGITAGAGAAATLPGLGDRLGNRPAERPGIQDRRDQLSDRMASAGDGRGSMADRQGQRQDSRQDRLDTRQGGRQDRLDDRQAYRDQARNEWQNWHDNRYGYHGGWYHGYWGGAYWNPGARLNYWWDNYPVMTAFGMTTWAVNRIGYAFGWYGYSNPYAGGSSGSSAVYDYSQPIVVESAPASDAPADSGIDAPPGVPPEALSQFDTARQQFYSSDFNAALASVDGAIELMPGDAVLHEFRAVTLFALQRYQDSAATLYAVLSAGPGWDWTTMSGLYPSVDVYTQQLRALEAFQKSHPDDPSARLVLAYHYLTAGHKDAAKAQLQALVHLTPDDPLAKSMLAEIDPTAVPEASPPATSPPPAGDALQLEAVMGTWMSTRQGGDSFTMELKSDGAFTWTYSSGSDSQSVSGVYAIDQDSVIAMEMEDGGTMLAQLKTTGDGQLDFMMLGDDRGSEPLKFARSN